MVVLCVCIFLLYVKICVVCCGYFFMVGDVCFEFRRVIFLLVWFFVFILFNKDVNLLLFFWCCIFVSLRIWKWVCYKELYIVDILFEGFVKIGFWVIVGNCNRFFIVNIEMFLNGCVFDIILYSCLWIVSNVFVLIIEILLIIINLMVENVFFIIVSFLVDSGM